MNYDLGEKILQDFEKNDKNCLFLTDYGLNRELIVSRMIQKYAVNSRLLIILNMHEDNSEYLIENNLKEFITKSKINVSNITKRISKYRQKVYIQGGVIFLTSKVFVLDVLEGIISPDLVDFLIAFQIEKYETNQFELIYNYIKTNSTKNSKPTHCMLFSKKLQFLQQNELNFLKKFQVNQILWPYIRKEIQDILNSENKMCEQLEYCIELPQYKQQIQIILVQIRQNLIQKITKYFKIEENQLNSNSIIKYGKEAQEFYSFYYQIINLFYLLCEQNLKVFYVTIINLINNITSNFHQFMGKNYGLLVNIATICRVNFFQIEKLDKSIEIQKGLTLDYKIIFNFDSNQKFSQLLKIFKTLEEQISENFQTQSTQKNDSKEKNKLDELKDINKDQSQVEEEEKDLFVLQEDMAQQSKTQENEKKIFIYCDNNYKKELIETYINVFYKEIINLKSFFIFNLNQFLSLILDQKPVTNKLPFKKDILNIINNFLQYLIFNDKTIQFYGENELLNQEFDIQSENSNDENILQNQYADEELINNQNLENNSTQNNKTQKIFKDQNKYIDNIDFTQMYNWQGGNSKILNYIFIQYGDKQYNLKDICQNKYQNDFNKVLKFQIEMVNYKSTFEEKFSNIQQLKPTTIIFYDFCSNFHRELRTLNELNSQQKKIIQEPFQIFQIYIKNSIQSQNHFQYLQSKKKTFEILLKNFSQIPKLDFEQDYNKPANKNKYIIIDKREFSSRLPIEIYKQGINIIPKQLETGDYILSPQIAIERKDCATGDLFQSLISGRLRQQSRRMIKKYFNSYLLIENYQDSSLYQQNKLLSILRDFKNLQIIWSKDAKQTVQFFLHLKQNKLEPEQIQQKIKQYFNQSINHIKLNFFTEY